MLEFSQSGLNNFVKKAEGVSKGFKGKVMEAMDDARQRAEMYAQGYCPVDTGELIESIYTELLDNGFILGADAKHAVFNEFGSLTTPIGNVTAPVAAKKVGVRPFIRPSIYRVRQEMPKIFGGKMQELVSHG